MTEPDGRLTPQNAAMDAVNAFQLSSDHVAQYETFKLAWPIRRTVDLSQHLRRTLIWWEFFGGISWVGIAAIMMLVACILSQENGAWFT
jgi:hypothetical protein